MLRNCGGLLVVIGIAAGIFSMPIPDGGHDGSETFWSRTAAIVPGQVVAGRDGPAVPLAARTAPAPASPVISTRPASQIAPAGQQAPVVTPPQRAAPVIHRKPISVRPVVSPTRYPHAGLAVRPLDGTTRWKLARDLQRELKRVGCYSGKVDGSWGAGSRRAMAGFVRRVNASLPVEEPDHILLSLLRSQRSQVCGRECPIGSHMTANGSCRTDHHAGRDRLTQRTAGALHPTHAGPLPLARGIVTPMPGKRVTQRARGTQPPASSYRPPLRIVQPVTPPLGRSARHHDLDVIATRVPTRLQGSRTNPHDGQRWPTTITPGGLAPPALAPPTVIPPEAQVAGDLPPPRYYLGAAPEPPRQVIRRTRRTQSFRSKRARATFWRNLERESN